MICNLAIDNQFLPLQEIFWNIKTYSGLTRSNITFITWNIEYWKIYLTMYNWLIIFMNEKLNECNACIFCSMLWKINIIILCEIPMFSRVFFCREYFIWPRWGENFSTTKKLFVASCKTQYIHKCLLSTLLSFEAFCFFFEKLCNVIICKILYFPLAT